MGFFGLVGFLNLVISMLTPLRKIYYRALVCVCELMRVYAYNVYAPYYAFITSPLTITTTTSRVGSIVKVCRQYKYRFIIVHGHTT